MGYDPISRTGFLYAKGEVPVLLVAHLDTVHASPVRTLCRSEDHSVLMSPEGVGGDDRAGVYMIMELVRKHRCHVLFCEDEEHGGIGAHSFTSSKIVPDVNYIVELDRRGAQDAVFYDCDNPEFTDFICGFGFREELGTFSDISVIAPHLGVAAVNISAGYHNEHTLHEYIDLVQVHRNIDTLVRMLSATTPRFEYIPRSFSGFTPIRLSPTCPGSYLISSEGELVEADESVWVDVHGRPYEVFDGLYCAVRLPGYTALTSRGMPVRFDADAALTLDILPSEYL